MSARAIVLYDHDCGFCRWTLGLLLRWDRGRALWPAPIEGPVGTRWLAGMPVSERVASWHLVEAGGSVTSAGPALAPVLEYVPSGRVVARLLRLAPGTVSRAYRFVADHRSWFSRPVPRSWVAAATARVATRERQEPPGWAGVPPRDQRTAAG